jgi:thioredoxin reductase
MGSIFMKTKVKYFIKDRKNLEIKVVIAGGGDSALD